MKLSVGHLLVFTLGALGAPADVSASGLVAAWGDNSTGQILIPQGLANVKAVAAGASHSLALKADGRVVAWGSSGSPQVQVPADLTGVTAVAAGRAHSLALKADGTIMAWGKSSYGLTNIPPGLSNVVAIAAGYDHNLALKDDGTVVAWGQGGFGQTEVPPGMSGVIGIAAGRNHSLGLKVDGTVTAWGGNDSGQTNVPTGLSHVRAIACGSGFSLALKSDGTVVGWGNNSYDQATPPPGLSNVICIAAGAYHGLALRGDGTLIAWGADRPALTNIPAVLTNATGISAGWYHNLAIVFDGPPQIVQGPSSQELSWGTNLTLAVNATGWEALSYQWFYKGVALTNTSRTSEVTAPVLVIGNLQYSDAGVYTVIVSNAFGSVVSSGAVINVVGPPVITRQPTGQTVVAGADVTLKVTAEGPSPLTFQWQLTGIPIATATGTSLTLTNVQAVQSGEYSVVVGNAYGVALSLSALLLVTNAPPYILRQPASQTLPLGGCATFSITAKGSLPLSYQWRFNGEDILGATGPDLVMERLRYDQTGYYNVVVRNPFGGIISAKAFLSVVQAFIWGDEWFEATGSNFGYYLNPYAPTNVPPGLTNLVTVAAGFDHVLALKPDGKVAVWSSGYLPPPYNAVTNAPGSVTNVAAIAAAGTCNLVLRSNGTVFAWGTSFLSPGVTNVPSGVSNVIAIATGGDHCLALKSNGTVIGWGASPMATVPSGLSSVIAVAAGMRHSLALRADGTVTAWGDNSHRQTTVPQGLSNVIAIAAGVGHSLGLRADGTVAAWGELLGAAADPRAGFTNIVALAAGGAQCFALRADGSVVVSYLASRPFVPPGLSNVFALAAGAGGNSSDRTANWLVALVGNGSPTVTLQPVSQTTARGSMIGLHARVAGVQPMRYQWQYNGQDLAGATDASLTLPNVQGKNGGGYRLIASNALGVATSRTATLSIPYSGTWAAALNSTKLVWAPGGIGASNRLWWFIQNRVTHEGEAAGQSGPIVHGEQSVLQTTVTGPGTLRFWWKASSEEGFDWLKLYQDSSNLLASISGEVDWEQRILSIPAGVHILRWTYSKDLTVSDGQDAAWLDEVGWVPSPTILVQPLGLTAPAGAKVSLRVSASGPLPLTFQWLKGGLDLAGATRTDLLLPKVGRRDAGIYAVRVSNPGGSVLSSNVSLRVLVPQRLGTPVLLPDGGLRFPSSDVDGGYVRPEDLPGFEAQASTDLTGWCTLTNALSWTNGALWLLDWDWINYPRRFYRVIEH
jgi:alpha-tubulin suppressor-like RCC1 family protein